MIIGRTGENERGRKAEEGEIQQMDCLHIWTHDKEIKL